MTDAERAEWLAWRRGGIGASDVACAVTGEYGGAYGVVADKRGYEAEDGNDDVKARGHRWEHPLADALLQTHGLYVIGEQMWAEHPDRPTHRATVEGFVHWQPEAHPDEVDDLLEIKTTNLHQPPKWWYYLTQTQWQMHVTGTSRTLLIVATVDDAAAETPMELDSIRYRWILRDQAVIDRLVSLADELWAHVQAKTWPEPSDGSVLAYVKAANAKATDGAEADIDPVAGLIAEYQELRERFKHAESVLKTTEAKIRQAMGEATEAKTSDGRWRVRVGQPVHKFTKAAEADALDLYPDYGRISLDLERFKAEQPDLYEALRRPTNHRIMTIKDMEA